jgi:hypothetical protein
LQVRVTLLHADCTIVSRFATTVVRSVLTNFADSPQQAHFAAVLPENAFITQFHM